MNKAYGSWMCEIQRNRILTHDSWIFKYRGTNHMAVGCSRFRGTKKNDDLNVQPQRKRTLQLDGEIQRNRKLDRLDVRIQRNRTLDRLDVRIQRNKTHGCLNV